MRTVSDKIYYVTMSWSSHCSFCTAETGRPRKPECLYRRAVELVGRK